MPAQDDALRDLTYLDAEGVCGLSAPGARLQGLADPKFAEMLEDFVGLSMAP
jgi:hypothetical protein